MQKIKETTATLSINEDHYSVFELGELRIKFYTSPFLVKYCEIKKWEDSGYLEYTCVNSKTDELIEDSIDMAFIAS